MSKATKKKHVAKEVLEDYVVPDENQQIVKILASRGNNLHEVQTPDEKKYLVSMPSKFRKSIWIKRGDFVIVEPIEEGNKVCAEIVYILYPKQIKYLKSENLWPEIFLVKQPDSMKPISNNDSKSDGQLDLSSYPANSSDEEDENDDDLFVNTNRPQFEEHEDTESDEEEED